MLAKVRCQWSISILQVRCPLNEILDLGLYFQLGKTSQFTATCKGDASKFLELKQQHMMSVVQPSDRFAMSCTDNVISSVVIFPASVLRACWRRQVVNCEFFYKCLRGGGQIAGFPSFFVVYITHRPALPRKCVIVRQNLF